MNLPAVALMSLSSPINPVLPLLASSGFPLWLSEEHQFALMRPFFEIVLCDPCRRLYEMHRRARSSNSRTNKVVASISHDSMLLVGKKRILNEAARIRTFLIR